MPRGSRRLRHGPCPTCRRTLQLTFHHLIPRKVHRRPRFRRRYTREQLAAGVYLCRDCHDVIHRTYSEMDLARERASLGLLLADPLLTRQFDWLSRQRRTSCSQPDR
jgi:hypothetical protein